MSLTVATSRSFSFGFSTTRACSCWTNSSTLSSESGVDAAGVVGVGNVNPPKLTMTSFRRASLNWNNNYFKVVQVNDVMNFFYLFYPLPFSYAYLVWYFCKHTFRQLMWLKVWIRGVHICLNPYSIFFSDVFYSKYLQCLKICGQ